jgi:hypothetical protein
MSQKVGEYLGHDPIKLRFTTANANGSPKSILKRSLNQTVNDIMQPNAYMNPHPTTLFYERLDVSIVELETKRSLKIIWTGLHNKEEVCSDYPRFYLHRSLLPSFCRPRCPSYFQRQVWSMTCRNISRRKSLCHQRDLKRFEYSRSRRI